MDDRLGAGIKRNRILLYVTDEHAALIERLLAILPKEEAPTVTAAIFTAIRQWLKHQLKRDEYMVVHRKELLRLPKEAVDSLMEAVWGSKNPLYTNIGTLNGCDVYEPHPRLGEEGLVIERDHHDISAMTPEEEEQWRKQRTQGQTE